MKRTTFLVAIPVLFLLALLVQGAGLVIDNQSASIGAATATGTVGALSSAGYAGRFTVATNTLTARANWTTALANTNYVMLITAIDTSPSGTQYYLSRETNGCTVTWAVAPNVSGTIDFGWVVVTY